MAFKNNSIILFLDRNGISLYRDGLVSIQKLSFTPDVVMNSDVVDGIKLTSLVESFIQANKLMPTGFAIVLSDDVIYVKDLVTSAPKNTLPQGSKGTPDDNKFFTDEAQEFLSNVPFEDVMAKIVKVENANRIVAVNKDLIMTIANTFTNKGFLLEIVIPAFTCGRNINFATGLNMENAKAILLKAEDLKLNNMLTDQEKIFLSKPLLGEINDPLSSSSTGFLSGLRKKKNRRQLILVGIFIFLLIVLGVVCFVSKVSERSTSTVRRNISVKSSVSPVVSPVEEIKLSPTATVSALISPEKIKIIIDYPEESTSQATLKAKLYGLGFKNVVSKVSQISIPEKSLVRFSQDIPSDMRKKIMDEVVKLLPGISVLENQEASSTAKISIGKS